MRPQNFKPVCITLNTEDLCLTRNALRESIHEVIRIPKILFLPFRIPLSYSSSCLRLNTHLLNTKMLVQTLIAVSTLFASSSAGLVKRAEATTTTATGPHLTFAYNGASFTSDFKGLFLF